jgi:hypothetical protein
MNTTTVKRTKLSDYGYILKYPESVRRTALNEAIKELTIKGVLTRLNRMLAKNMNDEKLSTDYSWFIEQNCNEKKKNTVNEDESIAQTLKKRKPRASAVQAREIILTLEQKRGDVPSSDDESYHPDDDNDNDNDSIISMDTEEENENEIDDTVKLMDEITFTDWNK